VTTVDPTLAEPHFPGWAQMSDKRRAHVLRVTALLERWSRDLAIPDDEARAWRDAGLWHDALRDCPESELRRLVPGAPWPLNVLHGPAAASRLESEGETRGGVLDAIRWHTIGCATWDRTGRALYMADFLEPGRNFSEADRAFLVDHAPHDFDGVFRQVVRMRLEWTIRDGKQLFVETVELWNAVR
jgi:HD superfamily phosphohydrolase YqeK